MSVNLRNFAGPIAAPFLIAIQLTGSSLRKLGWGTYEAGFNMERWALRRRLSDKGGQGE